MVCNAVDLLFQTKIINSSDRLDTKVNEINKIIKLLEITSELSTYNDIFFSTHSIFREGIKCIKNVEENQDTALNTLKESIERLKDCEAKEIILKQFC